MANQRIMGALLARNAALSAGAVPAEASRAAIIGTIFPNPIMGALVGRALARKGDDAGKPGGGGGSGGGGQLPGPTDQQPLACSVDGLADSVGALATSVDKSATALDALARAGTWSQRDPNKITATDKSAPANPSQSAQKKA